MKYCECHNCGEFFELKTAQRNAFSGTDPHSWHTTCPVCGEKREIDILDFTLPVGTPVSVPSFGDGVISRCDTSEALSFEDIQYHIACQKGIDLALIKRKRGEFTLREDWKMLRRIDSGIQRVCHYPKNLEWSNAPCYNCADRTKCNADIFERLAQYEDTGLLPEAVAKYKKIEDTLAANGMSLDDLLEAINP